MGDVLPNTVTVNYSNGSCAVVNVSKLGDLLFAFDVVSLDILTVLRRI